MTQTIRDVVVIGSGAGGGTVTKVLTDLGINVLLLEAGPMITSADFKEHQAPYDVADRGVGPHAEAYFTGQAAAAFPRPAPPDHPARPQAPVAEPAGRPTEG